MEKVEKELFGESSMPNYHKIVTGLEGKAMIREERDGEGEDSSSGSGSSDSDSEEEPKEGESA
jgi:hypothetical protein